MTVVVTGASGHIGANLVRALIERRRLCRAIVRQDQRALEGLDVERVHADVLDRDSLTRAFQDAEVVYHLAARVSIVSDKRGGVHETNVVGTRNVVWACVQYGVKRLVHFSSIHAFSQHPLDAPLDESRARVAGPKALTYDRSKALGEAEVRAGMEKGLDAVIVNPTGVLGPYDFKPSLMGQVLINIYRRRLSILVDGGFDWVDVRDVVQGAMTAETEGRTGENYLLSGHWLSIRELAEVVHEVTGADSRLWICPMWLARFAGSFVETRARLLGKRPLFTRASLSSLRGSRSISKKKAQEDLGYSARPIAGTIRDTFDWLKSSGRI
jgi:dihydroflavonol-4-reductase